jgi:hypothetical protein
MFVLAIIPKPEVKPLDYAVHNVDDRRGGRTTLCSARFTKFELMRLFARGGVLGSAHKSFWRFYYSLAIKYFCGQRATFIF